MPRASQCTCIWVWPHNIQAWYWPSCLYAIYGISANINSTVTVSLTAVKQVLQWYGIIKYVNKTEICVLVIISTSYDLLYSCVSETISQLSWAKNLVDDIIIGQILIYWQILSVPLLSLYQRHYMRDRHKSFEPYTRYTGPHIDCRNNTFSVFILFYA
jgi:hypothetical protein